MQPDLNSLRDRPFELLVALDARLQASSFAGGGVEHEEVWVGLAFRVGDRSFVAPRADVREVLPPPEYTRVPGAKPWLLGIANVRGDLLPIIDLKRLLGSEATGVHRASRVMVFSSDDVPAGFVVDEVLGFKRFQPQDQRHEMVPDDGSELSNYLLGAFLRDGQLWLAFSLNKLAAAATFQHAAA
jgi:twitching motility protein PilI